MVIGSTLRTGRQHRRRWLLLGCVIVLGVALGGYLFASWSVWNTLAAVSGACHEVDAADTPQSFHVYGLDDAIAAQYAMPAPQDVTFRSRDPKVPDLVLSAWWIPGRTATGPAVILVHGLDSCRKDDNILMPAGMLHRNGFGVLLMDQRDHGDSGDEDLKFAGGTEEYLDVLGAWDWLVAQGVPEARIGIVGMSFGAATVTIAGGEEPRVRAVWEDSAFADIEVAMRDYLVLKGYPDFLEPGAVLVARVLSGDDLTSKSPLREIPNYAGRRLAIIHGAEDETLPVRYAETLRAVAVASGVDLRDVWIVPGMKHTRAVVDERVAYEPRLVKFFTEALGAP